MKRISTLNMSREEWLKLRKNGIGGSDAGAVCGVNPYSSAIQVFVDKRSDDISDYDNEAMREGRDLEDYVAKRFTDETGKKVRKANYMYIDEEYPFMFADVDRLIVGENAALECKTVNAYNADKWADGKVPPHYKIQCYHYMSVLGLDCVYIAALVLGKEFIWRKIERDDEVINNLRCIEQAFWENNVLAGIMPDPDGSTSASSWIKDRFPEAKQGTSIALTGFDEKLKRRSEVSKLLDKLKKEKEQIEQEVKMFLGDMEEARNNHFKVMWKNVISSRLDTTRLKNENPEIYNQYVVDNVSRRLSIREV